MYASSRKRSALAFFLGDISYKLHFVVFFASNQFYDCFASKSVLLICKFFENFFLIVTVGSCRQRTSDSYNCTGANVLVVFRYINLHFVLYIIYIVMQ